MNAPLTTDHRYIRRELWHKCQVCGRFIAFDDFVDGKAVHRLLEPDSDLGGEKWETLCQKHRYGSALGDCVSGPTTAD